MTFGIVTGDNLRALRAMAPNSVDAIVTDPPYGLSFMAKKWDYDVPSVETWRECLRVLKPGGFLLSFGGARTYHRLAVNIEDAGFEIRDQVLWIYGSGFPKSHNVAKAIDKMKGFAPLVVGSQKMMGNSRKTEGSSGHRAAVSNSAEEGVFLETTIDVTAPSSPEAQRWDGWGTALKPAHEPIVVARKPFKGTVAANMLEHGTGALNIDATRIPAEIVTGWSGAATSPLHGLPKLAPGAPRPVQGRWPANVMIDGSPDVVAVFPEIAGRSASRYFYAPKTSKKDRDEGLEDFTEATAGERAGGRKEGSAGINPYAGTRTPARNVHPTVKPTELMRYLCRLVTQPGGLVVDPFAGSGSTGKAAILEGFDFIGLEMDPDYAAIARARCAHAEATKGGPDIFDNADTGGLSSEHEGAAPEQTTMGLD